VNKHQETITDLLEQACPSIQSRTRTELLGQASTDEQVDALQDRILQDELVKQALGWEGPAQWKNSPFHGRQGLEAGVRILSEKGVRKDHPAIQRALVALREEPDIIYRGIGRPGKVLDELGLGGAQMIKAVVFAYAGAEHEACVEEQIKIALEGVEFLLSVESLAEITEWYRDSLVFKPAVLWPGIYHLRLLAYTRQWRTPGHGRRTETGRIVADPGHPRAERIPIDRTGCLCDAGFQPGHGQNGGRHVDGVVPQAGIARPDRGNGLNRRNEEAGDETGRDAESGTGLVHAKALAALFRGLGRLHWAVPRKRLALPRAA
jgi:hypothetical protein